MIDFEVLPSIAATNTEVVSTASGWNMVKHKANRHSKPQPALKAQLSEQLAITNFLHFLFACGGITPSPLIQDRPAPAPFLIFRYPPPTSDLPRFLLNPPSPNHSKLLLFD